MFVIYEAEKAKIEKLNSWQKLEEYRQFYAREAVTANRMGDRVSEDNYIRLNKLVKHRQSEIDCIEAIEARTKYKKVLKETKKAIENKDRVELRRLSRIKNEIYRLLEERRFHDVLKIEI